MNFAVVATAASIAVLGLVAIAPSASAKEVPEVQVRHAVARMVVIVEDRTDVAVEIEGGTAGLPRPTVTRRGDEIRIDGELGRNAVRSCEGGAGAPGGQPGQTSSVEVRNHGRVQVSAAPLIVVRTPRQVEVSVSDGSAVFGAVGRGATSISLSSSGCGDWTVANTSGELDVSLAGSGDVWAGDAGSLDVSLAGSGRVSAGATRSLEVAIAGSGSVTARQVDGPVDASIAGSGDVVVRGDAGRLDASIAGSGSVIVRGRVASIDSSIMGSGDVVAGSVAGSVSQNSVGSGRVRVGS